MSDDNLNYNYETIEELRNALASRETDKIKEILNKYSGIHNEIDVDDFIYDMDTPGSEKDIEVLKILLKDKEYRNFKFNPNFLMNVPLEKSLFEAFEKGKIDLSILKLARFDQKYINYDEQLIAVFDKIISKVEKSKKDIEMLDFLLENSTLAKSMLIDNILEMYMDERLDFDFMKRLNIKFADDENHGHIVTLDNKMITRSQTSHSIGLALLALNAPPELLGLKKINFDEAQERRKWFDAIIKGDIETISNMIKEKPDVVRWENVDEEGYTIYGQTALAYILAEKWNEDLADILLKNTDQGFQYKYKGKTLGEWILTGMVDKIKPKVFVKNNINYYDVTYSGVREILKIAKENFAFSERLSTFGLPDTINRLRGLDVHELEQYLPALKERQIDNILGEVGEILEQNSRVLRVQDKKYVLFHLRDFLNKNVNFEAINKDGTIKITPRLQDLDLSDFFKDTSSKDIASKIHNFDLQAKISEVIQTQKDVIKLEPTESENALKIIFLKDDLEDIISPKVPAKNWAKEFSLETFEHLGKDDEDSFWFMGDKGDIEALKSPSIALILDYYSHKNPEDPEVSKFDNVYIVNNRKDLGEILDICDDFPDGQSIKLLYQGDDSVHCNLIVFKKNKSMNEISLFESTGLNGTYPGLFLKSISSELNVEQLSRTTFYCNENARQSDTMSCAIFSIKDCKNIEKDDSILNEIREHAKPDIRDQYLIQPAKPGAVAEYFTPTNQSRLLKFTLPSRFMGLTQSGTAINTYETEHPKLASVPVKGEPLRDYVFKKRNKEGRLTTPRVGVGGKLINNSADYFKEKYLAYIKKTIKACSQEEVQRKINRFDASKHKDDIRKLCNPNLKYEEAKVDTMISHTHSLSSLEKAEELRGVGVSDMPKLKVAEEHTQPDAPKEKMFKGENVEIKKEKRPNTTSESHPKTLIFNPDNINVKHYAKQTETPAHKSEQVKKPGKIDEEVAKIGPKKR
jgi:hypothetical protein